MIKIWCEFDLAKKMNAEMIRKKIEYARESAMMKDFLSSLRFDSRYTKPITLSGWDILDILYKTEMIVVVSTYTQNYFQWRFTPVNAFVWSNTPEKIFVNTRQLNRRSPRDWEETLWHELVHVADQLSVMRFDHGDNSLFGKDETAPVKFAKEMAALKLPVHKVKENV